MSAFIFDWQKCEEHQVNCGDATCYCVPPIYSPYRRIHSRSAKMQSMSSKLAIASNEIDSQMQQQPGEDWQIEIPTVSDFIEFDR